MGQIPKCQDITKEKTKETSSNISSMCIPSTTIAGAGQHSFNTCLRLPFHVSGCRMRLPHPFSRLDECTELFPCVRQTRAANAPAFEDPAVLDSAFAARKFPCDVTIIIIITEF